jgi:hypothetical protein
MSDPVVDRCRERITKLLAYIRQGADLEVEVRQVIRDARSILPGDEHSASYQIARTVTKAAMPNLRALRSALTEIQGYLPTEPVAVEEEEGRRSQWEHLIQEGE